MSKKKFTVLAIVLSVMLQILAARPAQALTGNAAAQTWYAQWEPGGNDWKVIFLIPSAVRQNGFAVQSSRYIENLVVSRSTFERQRLGNGMDKVTMTTGFRARAWVGYETIPWSNINLNSFARSLRIYYWT